MSFAVDYFWLGGAVLGKFSKLFNGGERKKHLWFWLPVLGRGGEWESVVLVSDEVAGVTCLWLENDVSVKGEKIEAWFSSVHSRYLGTSTMVGES